jgi:hypothetical protein
MKNPGSMPSRHPMFRFDFLKTPIRFRSASTTWERRMKVKLIKMFCRFQKAATGSNVIGAFRKAGIMSRWDDEHRELVCFFDRVEASDARHWNQTKRRISLEGFSGEA